MNDSMALVATTIFGSAERGALDKTNSTSRIDQET
jgi:hypothetical protein